MPESPKISFLYSFLKVLANPLFSNGIKAKTTKFSLCLLCLIIIMIIIYLMAPQSGYINLGYQGHTTFRLFTPLQHEATGELIVHRILLSLLSRAKRVTLYLRPFIFTTFKIVMVVSKARDPEFKTIHFYHI